MRAAARPLGELVERRLWPVALLLVVGARRGAARARQARRAADRPPTCRRPWRLGRDERRARCAASPRSRSSASPRAPSSGAPLRGQREEPVRPAAPRRPRPASTQRRRPRRRPSTDEPAARAARAAPAPAARLPKPRPKTYLYASVDVRFGRAGFAAAHVDDVPRLTPLPNAADPVAIFIGHALGPRDGRLHDLHRRARAGPGQCVPSTEHVRGDRAAGGRHRRCSTSPAADGSVTQYELDLDERHAAPDDLAGERERAYARSSACRHRARRGAAPPQRRSRARCAGRRPTVVLEPAPDGTLPRARRIAPQTRSACRSASRRRACAPAGADLAP